MKKILFAALCVCAVFTLCLFVTRGLEKVETDEVKTIAESKDLDVTDGTDDEGIFFMSVEE